MMKAKKLILTTALVLMLIMCAGVVAACDGNSEPPVTTTAITLSQTSYELGIGDTLKLNARTTPSGQKVEWSASGAAISLSAMSDTSATVTGLSVGTATVTAKSGNFSATCTFTVSKVEITLDKTTATLDVMTTRTVTLKAEVTGTSSFVSWNSSDPTVASVIDGVVSGLKAGTTTITASIGSVSAACAVTVTSPADFYLMTSANNAVVIGDPGVWYYFLANGDITSYYGNGTAFFSVTDIAGGRDWYMRYQPDYAVGAVLDVSYDLTIDTEAFIRFGGATTETVITATAMPAGTYKIKSVAETGDGANTIIIGPRTVHDTNAWSIRLQDAAGVQLGGTFSMKVSNFTVSERFSAKAAGSLEIEKTSQITLYNTPDGGVISYASSSNAIATVSTTGLITAVGEGTATITVTCVAGGNTQTVLLRVIVTLPGEPIDPDTEPVTLSASKAFINQGGTLTLTVTSGVTDVSWTTSGASIATVSDGVVTGVANGEATITASASGGRSATCVVTVVGNQYKVTASQASFSGSVVKDGSFYRSGSYYTSLSMTDGTITLTAETQQTTTTSAAQQIRYVGADSQGTLFEKYVFILKLTNNTDKALRYQGNLNGTTAPAWLTLAAGKSVVVCYQCDTTATAVSGDKQLNFKLIEYGIGTISMSDIYIMPVDAF